MSYTTLATPAQVQATIAAMKPRGISAEVVTTKEAALDRIKALIPAGASLATGASLTLRQIGFDDLLKTGGHSWRNLKAGYLAEKDPVKQGRLRKESTMADFYLGSVHAVAETGEVVVASMTGSQLAPYAYSSPNLVWVVGTQKIAPTLEAAIRRVREYVLPEEHKRQLENTGGKMGSMIGKLLIFENEVAFMGRKIFLIFVDELVGS